MFAFQKVDFYSQRSRRNCVLSYRSNFLCLKKKHCLRKGLEAGYFLKWYDNNVVVFFFVYRICAVYEWMKKMFFSHRCILHFIHKKNTTNKVFSTENSYNSSHSHFREFGEPTFCFFKYASLSSKFNILSSRVPVVLWPSTSKTTYPQDFYCAKDE